MFNIGRKESTQLFNRRKESRAQHFEDAVEPWQEGADDQNAEDINEIGQPLADLEELTEAEENSLDGSGEDELFCEETSYGNKIYNQSPNTISPSEDEMPLSPVLMKHIRAKENKENFKAIQALKEPENDVPKTVVISIH